MNVVYIVMTKTWNNKTIAKIFDLREKAEDYIKKQKIFYPNSNWWIDTWRVN